MAARTILFTGFPGFIGARLIPLLLEQDPDATVVALVEPRMVPKARSVAQELGLDDRLQIQSGDITARGSASTRRRTGASPPRPSRSTTSPRSTTSRSRSRSPSA